MLIRGLQNPFVTRSMSFQHEDVEWSFYLVFVLSVPCSFLFTFCSPSGFSSSWCTCGIHSFNPLFGWYCEDHVAYLPFVSFWFWYSSCFDVKCWFHTFPKRLSHISMRVLVLLDHRDFHLNPFQPVCLLFKLFHTDAVEKSDVLSVSCVPSCLCFPALLPFSWVIQLSPNAFLFINASALFSSVLFPVIRMKILKSC